MRVDVTQEDIRRGVRRSSTECPFALALQRATGDIGACAYGDAVVVRGKRIYCPDMNMAYFVSSFDRGCEVHPVSVELPI